MLTMKSNLARPTGAGQPREDVPSLRRLDRFHIGQMTYMPQDISNFKGMSG
jgi:hypothetical protein